jgi:hypothetical protein
MPFSFKNSSIEVLRNLPLMRNSNGIGFSDFKRLFTSVDSAYRRKPEVKVRIVQDERCSGQVSLVGTMIAPVSSGSCKLGSSSRVVKNMRTCAAFPSALSMLFSALRRQFLNLHKGAEQSRAHIYFQEVLATGNKAILSQGNAPEFEPRG